MVIAVTGGTGMAGGEVVRALVARARGGLTNPTAPRGRLTFEAWLRERPQVPA
jgi:uncharacterized protein YbjT (DUF2867 family)